MPLYTLTGAVAKAGDTMTGALNWSATQTIASAATTDIGAATSNSVIVSGTTTITALGTIAAGAERVVQFSGALTLTHNETSLILPGGASITTAAGDVAYFVSLGSGNWRCTGYQKANGQAVVASGGTGDFKSDGSVAMTGALTTNVGTFTSAVANGASAVAFDYNTPAYSTAGALIARFKNNGVTKATIDKDGNASFIGAGTLKVDASGGGAVYVLQPAGPTLRVLNTTSTAWSGFSASYVGVITRLGFTASIPEAGTFDAGLERDAAGVTKSTDGAGNLRDHKVRNIIATGNSARGIVAKTANYTVTANDGVIECDATSGAITLTLPAVSGAVAGTTYTLKKTDSSANAVIFDGNASETIDGATTVQTTTQWSSITIIRNTAGTAWLTIKD